MAIQDLELQLRELRAQLEREAPLSDEERASLHALAQDIETRLASDHASDDDASLVDGVNLAVERFEASHPNTAMTLRNIMQSLVSMGI